MDKLPSLSVLSTAIELPLNDIAKAFSLFFLFASKCSSSLWKLFTSSAGVKRSNLLLFPGTYTSDNILNLAKKKNTLPQIHIVK